MEANQILQSGFLDILFDGRNKLYGAYDLRKTYNQRISKALLAMVLSTLVLVTSFIISKRFDKDKTIIKVVSPGLFLKKIAPDKLKALPKLPHPIHFATVKVTQPLIVKEVTDPPPDVHQIEAAMIDIKTVDGPKPGIGIVNPPTELIGTNIIAKPENKSSKEKPFTPIEMEARFPGGEQAWQKYIQKAIQAQLDEFSDNDYGTCVVKFIVDINGNVSNVEATTMKGTRLAEIAVNTIRKGPKWIPAMQNGRYVTAARFQPVRLLNPNQ
ncbi:MAG: energy transducer TonB [Bacteroidota bacterium]|nr:energy transducer TonB [Bacteroidota bacterium]